MTATQIIMVLLLAANLAFLWRNGKNLRRLEQEQDRIEEKLDHIKREV